MLKGIERSYGRNIHPERLARARSCHVCYLDSNDMRIYLQRRYPKMSKAERENILGIYERQRQAIIVRSDKQMVRLPTTITHERLHQLSDPRFKRAVGWRMSEGTTEFLTQRVRRDIPLADYPVVYARESAAIEKIVARVGRDRLERAYFRGEISGLARELDRQLGRGAFNRIRVAANQGDWSTVDRILIQGVR
jgi:hypothetical protein